ADLKVEQSPPSLIIREGQAGINCDHSVTTSDTLLWYRQDQGKSLESLFLLMSNGAVRKKGGLTASLDTKARRSPLHITASHPGLSAIYFCAMDAVSS
uniref:T cell receptor alpha variable 39 n=1 Tax=Ovis aries TaxID=9940 RepID=A0AC11D1R6_SHEEP